MGSLYHQVFQYQFSLKLKGREGCKRRPQITSGRHRHVPTPNVRGIVSKKTKRNKSFSKCQFEKNETAKVFSGRYMILDIAWYATDNYFPVSNIWLRR